MNQDLKKTTRKVLILSGGSDALLGAFLLLLGFDLLPIDIRAMGFENWQFIAAGAIIFLVGVGVMAYNLPRLEE